MNLRASRALWKRRVKSRTKAVNKAKKALATARKNNVHPRQRLVSRVAAAKRELAVARRAVDKRNNQLRVREEARWGGSRYYTNRAVRIVGDRARVTSRKRWELFGNPGSDHYRGKKSADAVDFGIANAHGLADELSQKLGGPRDIKDYGTWTTRHGGRTYRHQLIAGTHGTGPHLHYGVERVGG